MLRALARAAERVGREEHPAHLTRRGRLGEALEPLRMLLPILLRAVPLQCAVGVGVCLRE